MSRARPVSLTGGERDRAPVRRGLAPTRRKCLSQRTAGRRRRAPSSQSRCRL
jgi:hypothetical protein